jgi:hypothetical protein
MTASSAFYFPEGIGEIAVDLSSQGSYVSLSHHLSKEYAGAISSSGLSGLMERFSVFLPAALAAPEVSTTIPAPRKQWKMQDDLLPKPLLPKECCVRILVHEFSEQAHEIADFLADEGLFLRHPFEDEVGDKLKYDNPQFFRRPGAGMPPLEKRPATERGMGVLSHGIQTLTETMKSRIMHIFDQADHLGKDGSLASNLEVRDMVQPSPRLKTQLLE